MAPPKTSRRAVAASGA